MYVRRKGLGACIVKKGGMGKKAVCLTYVS